MRPKLPVLNLMPNKSTLILIAVGAGIGYFIGDSFNTKDFNGQTDGTGPNPFRYAYAYGYGAGSGTKVQI